MQSFARPFRLARRVLISMALDDLAAFHGGAAGAMERCYREHFSDVRRAVSRVLRGADEEATIHQVFYRILSDAHLRASFRGGSFSAWISTVARNEAIDCRRRRDREARHVSEEATRPADDR